ncbi:hypothetical protein D046_9258, partial [Vibrio parahaemolyticus V-223/04]
MLHHPCVQCQHDLLRFYLCVRSVHGSWLAKIQFGHWCVFED